MSIFLRGALIILVVSAVAEFSPRSKGDTQSSIDFTEANRTMEAAYQRLLKALDPPARSALQEAQKKWRSWRDAEAEFDAHELKGGTVWADQVQASRAQLTRRRTVQLSVDFDRFGPISSLRDGR